MFPLPISMPCFKSIIFYQCSPKIKLFLQKTAKLSSAGGNAPRPPCLRRLGVCPQSSGGWGLHPRPQKKAPPMQISGYAPVLSFSVLCANSTHKYPNSLFKCDLHLPQHTSARAVFQLLYISKTKARNQRKVEDDIRLALSSTKSRIPKLALWLQSLPSH